MPGNSNIMPDDYEIMTTLNASGEVREYIASYKPEKTLVLLRVYSFADTTDTSMHRHQRTYLRKDVSFMEELKHNNIVRLFDFSETKRQFWIATQPAKMTSLSESFPKIASLSLEKKISLIVKLLATVEYMHNCGVVHLNLSSNAVFLGSELELYVGDFGLARYLTDVQTSTHDTLPHTSTSGATYQAPEIRDAKTTSLDVCCDVFSAGLLAIEILCGSSVSKEVNEDFYETLKQKLEKQGVIESTKLAAYNVLLKAIKHDPVKRWSNIKDFSSHLRGALRDKLGSEEMPQISDNLSDGFQTEIINTQELEELPEKQTSVAPLNAENKIWNNRYEILEKVGGGGQAIVYKALDHLTNEEIAVKTLLSRHKGNKTAVKRLKQEAMISRSLTHKYIVRTYSVEQHTDIAEGNETVFICMELIGSGLELKDVVNRRSAAGRGFELNEVLHITRQLLEALKYAHSYTIHRDIKPGNIMLVPHEGQESDDTLDLTRFDIRLMDFGIAKVLTQKRIEVTGKGFWSAHYGAPELADVKSTVDARADLYSVGIIMYQMLTGHIPRKGSPSANKINKNVPAALSKVVDKAINADREKRFRSAAVLTREIERAASKFSWIAKTLKMSAGILVVAVIITLALYISKSEYKNVKTCITILKDRIPTASFTNNNIKCSDLKGFEKYDELRTVTLEKLEDFDEAGIEEFKASYSSWKDQERAWSEIQLQIDKLEQIQENQKIYNRYMDLSVIASLKDLDQSAEILSRIKIDIETAEMLLNKKPLTKDIIGRCNSIYDSAAAIYTNINNIFPEQTAEEIDTEGIKERFNNIMRLRTRFQMAQDDLSKIDELKKENFQEWSNKCLEKADSYYNRFELKNAEQHFTLLNQICGTISDVKNEIDFDGSDIGLIVSRLMELCYEDIETFENAQKWKEKLEIVHEKNNLLARYIALLEIIEKGPKSGKPPKIKALLEEIRNERDSIKSARKYLRDAESQYKKFLGERIDGLRTIPAINNNMGDYRGKLEQLRGNILDSEWLEIKHVREYKKYSDDIKKELSEDASDIRINIVKICSTQTGTYSWKWESKRNPEYTINAKRYTHDDIRESIRNWKNIDDVKRISSIVIQMRDMQTLLDRKDKLDNLRQDINDDIEYCESFRGSLTEKAERQEWLSDLEKIKEKLIDNTYIIDLDPEKYDPIYKNVFAEYEKVHAKFPVYSKYVEQLIKDTESLKINSEYINWALNRWRSVIAQDEISEVTFQGGKISEELEIIKVNVDNLNEEKFNQKIQPKCKIFGNVINQENQSLLSILGKVQLLNKRVTDILKDEKIHELNAIYFGVNKEKTVLEKLHEAFKQCEDEFTNIPDVFDNVSLADELTGFKITLWLGKYNKARSQLEKQVEQLKNIEKNIPEDVLKLLADAKPIEQHYYKDLKNVVVKAVNNDFSGVEKNIDTVKKNADLMELDNFLEKMGNDFRDGLAELEKSLSEIKDDMTVLESSHIDDLDTASDFNGIKSNIDQKLVVLRENLGKYNEEELESACKKAISNVPSHFKKLMNQKSDVETINDLCVYLWSFYSKHKDWDQWKSLFRELFHINIAANGQLHFASSSDFLPVNSNGNILLETNVSMKPADFFYIDTDEAANFGWPRYISHQNEPTLVFTFLPMNKSDMLQPFYMATHEISNAQFMLFLLQQKSKPSETLKLPGWSIFVDQNGSKLIYQRGGGYPPCGIRWEESKFVVEPKKYLDIPATWVTFSGAQSYAKWLGAQLPTASQHKYASMAGANSKYPWGDDFSLISNFAHVRTHTWKLKASEYNSEIDNPLGIANPPLGAVVDNSDYREGGKELNEENIVHENPTTYKGVWPIANAKEPNKWGLYDMIGNVWEWCKNGDIGNQQVICGGSCLSPPQYIRPDDSKYSEFKDKSACDIGFRVVIPAKFVP